MKRPHLKQQSCSQSESQKTIVEMDRVGGMQHMDAGGVILYQLCTLHLRWCDAVSMSTVKKAFPEMYHLSLVKITVEHDAQFPQMRGLWLTDCHDVNLPLLSRMYNVMQLRNVGLHNCEISFDDSDTKSSCTPTANVNNILYRLTLDKCEPCKGNGSLHLASIFQFARQYARSKILEIWRCQLLVDSVHEGPVEELPAVVEELPEVVG